ncbi:MAG: nickel pincer cofactor biosynthesis protein LarB [Syntrophobacterales bacterium]|nr:MAG: nickel pincer cofactor biosynthesis protein LarB [Syntrophobacterales bacterium]
MDVRRIEKLLEDIKAGRIEIRDALVTLRGLPFEDIGHTTIDHHRALRKGFSEVIFGEGKSSGQIISIMQRMKQQGDNILVTRVHNRKGLAIKRAIPEAQYYPTPRIITLMNHEVELVGKGLILVISAGTSDIPVAEEAALTAEMMGNPVERLYDVGISGIHRLFSKAELIQSANVIIVVAGMEGALPSVVGGLVDRPVIAVPTSVGYGASFGGVTALLAMLNSCASGISVVNIDNGFGAGCVASLINRDRESTP